MSILYTKFEDFVNESLISEAFQSDIMRRFSKTIKNLNQNAFNQMYIKWDKITDNMFTEYDVKSGKKYLKANRNAIGFFTTMNNANLLGVSQGEWVRVTDKVFRGRGKAPAPQFKTITSMGSSSESILIIDEATSKKLSTSTLKNERWANKDNALAFKQNYNIASENKSRYKLAVAELAKKKAQGNLDIKESIKEVMDYYMQLMEDLMGAPDWHKVGTLGDKIQKLMEMWKDFIWEEKHANYNYEHSQVTLKNHIINIKQLLQEADEYNKAQAA